MLNNFKLNKSSKTCLNILIVLSFLSLSIISVLLIWYNNKIYFTGDSPFHVARLKELLDSKYIFPRYALNSFDSVGSIVMTMYPYLFLYPMVIIFRITGSIKVTLYIIFIIGTFITLSISYLSSLKLTKSKLISYIFALIYAISYEFTNMYFSSSVIGVYWSSIFMPLVIFGFIYYLKYNKWLMLSIGMTLILFSSVITFLFLGLLLLLWLLVNYRLFDRNKIINLLKAGILTTLTTSVIWMPLLKIMMLNKLRILNNNSIHTIGLLHIVFYSIVPKSTAPAQSLTIYSLIGGLIGLIFFKHFSRTIKQLYLFGIFTILFCTPIFPWSIFDGGFVAFRMVRNIQMTCRMLVFPQVIFEFILSWCIVKILRKYCKNIQKYLILLVIAIVVVMQLGGQCISFTSHGINRTLNNKVLSNDDLASMDPGYHFDYFPKALTNTDLSNLRDHNGGNKFNIIHFKSYGNGAFTFTSYKHINKLTLPFLYYNGVDYRNKLNGKRINSYQNAHQLMTIFNVNKGCHYIHIWMPLTKVDIIARMFTAMSILVYVFILLKFIKLRSLK